MLAGLMATHVRACSIFKYVDVFQDMEYDKVRPNATLPSKCVQHKHLRAQQTLPCTA